MEIKLLPCPLCLQPHFEGVNALRSTLVSVATCHLSCPVCSESLLGLDKLTIHLFSHINNVEVTLKSNNKIEEEINKSIDRIAANTQTTIVESTHNQDRTNTCDEECNNDDIRCDICNFSFTDKNILEMHQNLLHQTPPDKKTGLYSYHCHLCSKKFKMRGSLMVHLRVAHYGFGSGQNNYEISESEPTTSAQQVTKLSEDVKEEKDLKVKNVVASCSYKLNGNKITDNKQWECDVCSKMFTTKYFLKKHKRLHTGEMPYCCTQCNKSFTFQQSYHKHMLYHSSEKPYVCNECGRAFKELSTLQNHARIHSGERPFACETCGKRFRQRVSYLVHRRIHTGVMPYQCTACEKTFRYKVSQRSHKCPMNPPGSVVRVGAPDSVEKTPPFNEVPHNSNTSETSIVANNVKCIMSVDYNTGSINFIPENNLNVVYSAGDITCNKSEAETKEPPQVLENMTTDLNLNNSNNEDTRDLFSVVLSPLLPEVASLCLTNSPSPSSITEGEFIDHLL